MNSPILKNLKNAYKQGMITKHQLKTFRGQVLSGNAQAAQKGLRKIIARKRPVIGRLYIDGRKLMDVYDFMITTSR